MKPTRLHNCPFKYLHRRALWASASILAILAANHSALAQEPTPVPDINVTETATQPATATQPVEGSEAAGYRPTTVQDFGPFGQMPILDVPYSVNVISSDLLENKLATPDDVFKISPVAQLDVPSTRLSTTYAILRGFIQTNTLAEDGLLTGAASYPMPLEDKERVEIFTGLTSFLYGPTNAGGEINYVYKRPTATALANVTIGDYGNLAGFVHGDFGGPIDKDGQFAYRLNIVGQHGDLPVDYQSLDRELVTAVVDWHIAPDTTLEVMGTHHY